MSYTRRTALATGAVGLAGCVATEGEDEDVDTGVVFDGERVLFSVGDGTGFVHKENIYEDRTDEYTVESSGRHTVRVSPERHEYPMNEDVLVHIHVELGEV